MWTRGIEVVMTGRERGRTVMRMDRVRGDKAAVREEDTVLIQ